MPSECRQSFFWFAGNPRMENMERDSVASNAVLQHETISFNSDGYAAVCQALVDDREQ